MLSPFSLKNESPVILLSKAVALKGEKRP